MSSLAAGVCQCCGRPFQFVSAMGYELEKRSVCDVCSRRGQLCMHNTFERYQDLEPGSFTVAMHSSKPHWDASGAADPTTCRWCIEPIAAPTEGGVMSYPDKSYQIVMLRCGHLRPASEQSIYQGQAVAVYDDGPYTQVQAEAICGDDKYNHLNDCMKKGKGY